MTDDKTLTLDRVLNATPEQLFRCWKEADLLKKWFVPAPWTIAEAEVDLRSGGNSRIVMQNPEGQQFPSSGVYLEVIPNKLIVMTDAFSSAWLPSEKPFFVCEVRFEDLGNGTTRYTAVARHWTDADRKTHEDMGFHTGWNAAADQLEALAQTL